MFSPGLQAFKESGKLEGRENINARNMEE